MVSATHCWGSSGKTFDAARIESVKDSCTGVSGKYFSIQKTSNTSSVL